MLYLSMGHHIIRTIILETEVDRESFNESESVKFQKVSVKFQTRKSHFHGVPGETFSGIYR